MRIGDDLSRTNHGVQTDLQKVVLPRYTSSAYSLSLPSPDQIIPVPTSFLERSPLPSVVLCGASILTAFLRGEPNQIVVSSVEASRVLEEAAPACQRCLDQLGERLSGSTGNEASGGRGTRTGVHLPRHTMYVS